MKRIKCMTEILQEDYNRFLSKIIVPDNIDDCWIWSGASHRGYGTFAICIGYGNDECTYRVHRTMGAHRASYLFAHGGIPDQALILHKCDVSMCVNPSHLYAGTHQDNMDDKSRRLIGDQAKKLDQKALNLKLMIQIRELNNLRRAKECREELRMSQEIL